MCNFLRTYIGNVVRMKYTGKMRLRQVSMSTSQRFRFDLGVAVTFFRSNAVSKIESRNGGDHLSFEGKIFLTRTLDMFPGTYVELHCVAYPGYQCQVLLLYIPFPNNAKSSTFCWR